MEFKKMPEIVAIGDSITWYGSSISDRGWVLRLSNKQLYRRNVINMGLTTFNTTGMKRMIQPIMNSVNNPVLYLIFLGTNDANVNGPTGQNGTTLDEFKSNLEYMIKTVNKPVLLVTPPPVYRNDIRFIDHTQLYRDAVLAIGKEQNLPTLDTWKFVNESILGDGIHFNPEGHEIFFNNIDPMIDSILGTSNDQFPSVNYDIQRQIDLAGPKSENPPMSPLYIGLISAVLAIALLVGSILGYRRLRKTRKTIFG